MRSCALLAALAWAPACQAQSDTASRLSLDERVYMASRIFATVEGYFNARPLSSFDSAYRRYVSDITNSGDDRRAFDLATMKLMSVLESGHSWFADGWLEHRDGAALGFYAEPVEGRWTVTRSAVADLRVGDVIVAVDGTPTDAFYQTSRPYLMDSDEREARADLFGEPYLFPKQFVVTLADHRTVRIVRSANVSAASYSVAGHWLEPNGIAYIRIPSFSGIMSESDALRLVRQFKHARGMIIDLRGNPGGFGNPPLALQASLMDRPFRAWHESVGRFTSTNGSAGEIVTGHAYARPEDGIDVGTFTGRLVLLVDHGCASYCEDFVMPFKDNHRATVVGDTTAGSYAQTYYTTFDNGMRLNVAVSRETFPTGAPFEGVGILPDIQVTPTVDDVRAHRDVGLERGLAAVR